MEELMEPGLPSIRRRPPIYILLAALVLLLPHLPPHAAESATRTIHDSNPHASLQQQVTLPGTATASGTPELTVPVSPASASITAGASANFTVTVTPISRFTSAVTVACSGAPPA